MSIPTVVTTTVPSVSSMMNSASAVASAVPSVANAAISIANTVPSVVGGVNAVTSAINSLPPIPSMNTVSNVASNVASGAKNAGIKTLSFMDKLMRDMGKLFSFKGMYNLSSLMLNVLIVIILINIMSNKTLPPIYATAIYVLIIASVLFYMISYVLDDEEYKHDLSTQPIVIN
jgi:hypothetical protein